MPRQAVVRPDGLDDDALARVMLALPSAMYLLTAAFEDQRGGYPVEWVMQAAASPACLAVAVAKGHPTVPLIRDSRAFGICLLRAADRRVYRRFQLAATAEEAPADGPRHDPFDGLRVDVGVTGAPLLRSVEAVFDCRVTCHVDFDADHELYIGEVVSAW